MTLIRYYLLNRFVVTIVWAILAERRKHPNEAITIQSHHVQLSTRRGKIFMTGFNLTFRWFKNWHQFCKARKSIVSKKKKKANAICFRLFCKTTLFCMTSSFTRSTLLDYLVGTKSIKQDNLLKIWQLWKIPSSNIFISIFSVTTRKRYWYF